MSSPTACFLKAGGAFGVPRSQGKGKSLSLISIDKGKPASNEVDLCTMSALWNENMATPTPLTHIPAE
jgi:hypothetical protein